MILSLIWRYSNHFDHIFDKDILLDLELWYKSLDEHKAQHQLMLPTLNLEDMDSHFSIQNFINIE